MNGEIIVAFAALAIAAITAVIGLRVTHANGRQLDGHNARFEENERQHRALTERIHMLEVALAECHREREALTRREIDLMRLLTKARQ